MTTKQALAELALYHNKQVAVMFEKITVYGMIVDRREIMGRVDWLFRPMNGHGEQWITDGRIQFVEEQQQS